MVTTSAAAGPAGLAAALRQAGVREIDTATRRRAEYSSDASNSRVVPAWRGKATTAGTTR